MQMRPFLAVFYSCCFAAARAATPISLTGIVGTVDHPLSEAQLAGQATPTGTVVSGGPYDRIFVPFESGFRAGAIERLFDCSGMGIEDLPGGLDTKTAAEIVQHECDRKDDDPVHFLDACGGHVTAPQTGSIYHYHEMLTCLYSSSSTGHSTRIGTANDGHGIYGKFDHGGVLPTDLDACGGHFGVPPGSTTGAVEYYYMMQDNPPFTLGCYGPVSSIEECRSLYATCGDDETPVTTNEGTQLYDLYCPCYDSNGHNVPSEASGPAPTAKPTSQPTTKKPTANPTYSPTPTPTANPTSQPTMTSKPTANPTPSPTPTPTANPTSQPTTTSKPTANPTPAPTSAANLRGSGYRNFSLLWLLLGRMWGND